jgi:type IV pilus assembly protein PilM
MASILSKANPAPQPGGRPSAAVEITPEGVLAAVRRADAGAESALTYAFAALPPGSVVPGIDDANLRAPETVAEAIRSALGDLGPRQRNLTLVIPDASVRVFVLDFDSVPARAEEALSILRFRLRKMVPFDVEHGGVSYQILNQEREQCKVLTAVLPGPILAEYEAAVRAAGYEPGAVLPSSLAALETAGQMQAVLAVNLSGSGMTTLIANGQDLLLYRTLDLPAAPMARVSEIQRGVAVAAAYYEDKLGAPPRKLYYAGNHDMNEFSSWLAGTLVAGEEMEVIELVARPESGMLTSIGRESIAGVSGALAGAR